MRQEKSTILYIYIIILVLIGMTLFVFRDNLASQILNYNSGEEAPPVITTSNNFKLDILRDSRVKALKNYISIFDYENLDKSQDALLAAHNARQDVIISNPDETATSTAGSAATKNVFTRVRVGNSNPFVVNKVAK